MSEPWLSGRLSDVHPAIAPILYSFEQIRDDVAHWTEGLTPEDLWAEPMGLGPVGFHLRHIAGSTGRLFTYAQDGQLTEEQMAALKAEKEPGAGREELLAAIGQTFGRIEESLRTWDPATLHAPRYVGRKRLPTSVIGLLMHMAEHAQRHIGELIVTAKVVRGLK